MSLTMAGRSALAYLLSRISTMHLVAPHVLTGSWARHVLCYSALVMLGFSCSLLIFLMGKRILPMVIVSLKYNTTLKSCNVCLPKIKLYNGSVPLQAYSTISGFK